ncbi:MAG: hypothetical protein OXFUSZZB_001576 [Candidatus Fervidibacter sp.]|jgi:4-hydroxy-tetrahydrodipicolinate reductase
MGQEVTKAVLRHPRLQLVAGVDVRHVGEDVGALLLGQPVGVTVRDDLAKALQESGAQVAVDFTHPSVVLDNVRTCLKGGVSAVVGTTGWTAEKIAEVDRLAKRRRIPVVIAPNFAIGAVLMMKFAAEAARYFERVEIIELHHDGKADAPSGTALRTAELIRQARREPFPPPKVAQPEVLIGGVLGGEMDGIRIHSVRLPGLVAHQEVLLGMAGQVLTIRHDALSREAFVPGVLIAIERVRSLPPGVTYGLENLL